MIGYGLRSGRMGTDSKAPKLSFELWLGLGVAERPQLWRLVLRFEI